MILVCLPWVSAKIMDYSGAHFIATTEGDVATFTDYDYLVHRTNLSEYESIIRETDYILKTMSDARMSALIKEQIREIERLLTILQANRRHARSLDFLGSALKFVAGTPDHSDLEVLTANEEALTENNNKQAVINSMLQERINDITDRVNNIIERKGSNSVQEEELILFELIIERNGNTISFLNGLALSVVLAKENIINPVIFDNIENTVMLKSRKIPISISNILKCSNISIFQNNSIIIQIIKYPVLTNLCKFLKIYPVIQNNSMLKLDINQASKCDEWAIPVKDCTSMGSTNICREANDTCLFQLLNNNTASCLTQSADHIPPVQRISEESILLNDVLNTSISETDTITVNGTVLITFLESVAINGTIYYNKEKKQRQFIKPHPPKILDVLKNSHETKITLPYLHKINLKNYELISNLQENIVAHRTTLIIVAISIPILLCLVCYFRRKKRQDTTNIEDIIQKIRSKQGRSDT